MTDKLPDIGDYIRWWEPGGLPGTKKSYAGTAIEIRPGWNYGFIVACIDGKNRRFCASTIGDKSGVIYKPEFINFSR